MTRAVGPRVGMPPEAEIPFLLIGVCWVPVMLAGSVWLGGHVASWATGHGWIAPPFTFKWGINLVSHGPRPSWPLVPPALVWFSTALLLAPVVTLIVIVVMKWRAGQTIPGHALGSMATAVDVAALCPPATTAKARQLRPSLGALPRKAPIAADDTGVPLGLLKSARRQAGPQIRACWEDVMVVFMAPRTGKTSEIAVPQILAAPGAVVATSNKVDLWAITAAPRAQMTAERVWVFDPQRIALSPQSWWWNPLAGINTVEAAQRLTTHFIAEVKGDREHEFWSSAAEDLLASLFLAAGSSGRTLHDVYEWLNRPTNPVPVDLLKTHGHNASASGLAGRQSGAPDTREGVYETARTAAKCLRDPNILAWVTPPPFDLEEFQTAGFAGTRQTLYLLTKDSAGGAAPLVAAFADRVMQDATSYAERRGGRLDPPLLVVLDEAANICKIADLPKLYSHLGSRGIVVVTILQSYPQGVGVWGETGMDTLWAASTVKLVGPGLDDENFLEKVSKLIGEHDVPIRAVHQGGGTSGHNISLRRQRILAVEDLRMLPKGTSVLFATGCKPAMLAMQPWYRGPQAEPITASTKAALDALTERARKAASAPVEDQAADQAAVETVAEALGKRPRRPSRLRRRAGRPRPEQSSNVGSAA